jgi:hypothetical protein
MGFTLAEKVSVLTKTSSPGWMSSRRMDRCSAAVPEESASACGAFTIWANSRSKASTCGPRGAIQLDAKASATYCSSRPLMCGAER